MRSLRLMFLLILSSFFLGSHAPSDVPSCRSIIDNMIDSVRKIKNQIYDVKSIERVDGRLIIAESHIKLNLLPRRIYLNNAEKGIEVLWVDGTNKGNATVHSRSIPLMNFDLDPLGSIMRKDQHHTIFDLGTPYVASVISNTILKAPKDFDKHFAYAGTLTWNYRECYQILISYPEYKYVEYTVGRGETVTSIANKLSTSDYKIRSKNELSSYFGTIKEGKKLLIPVPYSNKGIMFIDKKTFMPVNVKIYDEEGLYEAYEFYNIRNNVNFASNEFSKGYKGYGF